MSPGTVITTLDDTSVIKLDFTVPETYLFVLRRGLPITAAATGLPDRTFDGRRHEHGLARRLRDALGHRARRARESGRPAAPRHVHDRGAAGRGHADAARARGGASCRSAATRTCSSSTTTSSSGARSAPASAAPASSRSSTASHEHERVVVDGTQNVRDGSVVRRQRRPAARADACGSRSSPSGGRSSRPSSACCS